MTMERHSTHLFYPNLRVSVHEPQYLILAQLLSIPTAYLVKGPSPALACPSNDIASQLNDTVSNIPSTTMSPCSTTPPPLEVDPPPSQPTIHQARGLKMKTRACLARHKRKKPAWSSSRLSLMGAASTLPCPFCSEVGIQKVIKRKYDLIRHFKKFHKHSEIWRCPELNCGTLFDWKSALDMHIKKKHPHAQNPLEDSAVKPLPQLVFACGFSNSKTVFEARDGDDPEKIADKFFDHVADTIDKRDKDNLPPLDWKYSVRFRNLMRQKAVDRFWKQRTKGHSELVWQPHSSFVLRKLLETRHLSDTPLLVQWAIKLGSLPFCSPVSPIPELPHGLALPFEDGFSTESSDRGSKCPSDVQPDLPLDHPAPPATGPVDLGESFAQLPPASPQHPPAPDVSEAMVHQSTTFSSPYPGSQQAHFFQGQAQGGPDMFFPNTVYHDVPQRLLATLPAQQQPSPYPVGPLSYGGSSPGFIMPWYSYTMPIDPQLFSAGSYP